MPVTYSGVSDVLEVMDAGLRLVLSSVQWVCLKVLLLSARDVAKVHIARDVAGCKRFFKYRPQKKVIKRITHLL